MEKLFLLAEVAAKMPEAKLAAKNADKFDSRESSGYPEDIIEVQDQSSNSSSSPANIKVHMGTHIAGGRTVRKCSISFSRPSTLEDHRNYYDPSMLIPIKTLSERPYGNSRQE
uniref:Ovule protein n=1 Tax=Loa loa TaxID=7209 RepID=A0A1I7V7U0_LOALO